MRITKFNQKLTLAYEQESNNVIVLKENIEYVLPDIVVITLIKQGFQHAIVFDIDFYNDPRTKSKFYKGESLYGKKLITFRNGGIGDLIFQLPSIKHIKDIYKENVELTLCCNEQYIEIFKNLSYIDNSVCLPLELSLLLEHDYFVNFEGLIETNERAQFINAYDLHAEKFFVKPTNMIPILESDTKNDAIVSKQIDKNNINIVVAFQASANIRSVNPDVYANLIANVGSMDNKVKFYICGTKNQIKNIDILINAVKNVKIFNCVNWSKKYNDLGMTISLIKHSDCVIGPDSGLLHVAGGFNVPVIGLYGAFPSKLRLGYYNNTIGLDSMTDCIFGEKSKYKSCFQHGSGSCSSALKNAEVYSPCMNTITPMTIIDAMKDLKIIK